MFELGNLVFPETSPVNILELGWLVMGLVGLGVSCWGILDSWLDYAVAKNTGAASDNLIVAKAHIRKSVVRTVSNVTVTIIGIYAVTLSPSPYPQTPIGWIITAGLFVIPACTIFNCIEDRRMRIRFMKNPRRRAEPLA